MSNNPLEAVTQAVNSLLTALKLPDESAQANQILGEMNFPQFSRLLPYRDYNQESGLFMDDTDVCLAGSDHREISGAARKNEMYPGGNRR